MTKIWNIAKISAAHDVILETFIRLGFISPEIMKETLLLILYFQEIIGANGELGTNHRNVLANREPYGVIISAMSKVNWSANEE